MAQGEGTKVKPNRSIQRAMEVIECLALSREEDVRLAEISRALGLPKSTVYRVLVTLAQDGYVEQHGAAGHYRLTLRVMELGAMVRRKMRLCYQARPYVVQLWERVQEVVNLVVPNHRAAFLIYQVDRPDRFRADLDIGIAIPLHCTAAGKAILASLSPVQRQEWLGRGELQRFTEKTIVQPKSLGEELSTVISRGYAVGDGEYRAGMRGIGAVVRDRRGTVVAAIEVNGPAERLSSKRLGRCAEQILHTVEELSFSLGYRPEGHAWAQLNANQKGGAW